MYCNSFPDSGRIPDQFTCQDKKQRSPQLSWTSYQPNTKSFVLLMNDPDAIPVAGLIWQHWVLYDIPDTIHQLPEGITALSGMLHGKNSFGNLGYGGPCPPKGQNHCYFFILYALDIPQLGLASGATVEEIQKAMRNHVIESCIYKGRFSR